VGSGAPHSLPRSAESRHPGVPAASPDLGIFAPEPGARAILADVPPSALLDRWLRFATDLTGAAVARLEPGGAPGEGAHWIALEVPGAGVLHVADDAPRAWSAADRAALEQVVLGIETAVRLQAAEAGRHADPVTGLPTRDALVAHLERRLAGTAPVAVVLCDVPRLQAVSDAYGRAAHDALLVAVADRLRDRFGEDHLVGRLDDLTFALVPHAAIGTGQAWTLAEQATAVLASRATAGATVVSGTTPTEALRRAQAALHAARVAGPRVVLHDDAADRARREELLLVGELETAIERDELRLVLQPIIRLGDGAPVGLEALLRWRHPALGEIAPARFVPVAEAHGLIAPIGAWVVREATRIARLLNHDRVRPLWVSVNFSAAEVADPALADGVLGALADAGLAPELLRVEVTETAVLADAAATHGMLGRLRRAGVCVALDDFGTGFSSLTHLRDLPIDAVKVDRSFILAEDERDHAIVRALVGLAGGLGLDVIAEGIETAEQEDRLRAAGCPLGQGRRFAAPFELGEPVLLAA
jgi:EAL domain-containing protein (putative c-di-GMP-specific phosphodiesterase class I)/GGDEF domain-containing protein